MQLSPRYGTDPIIRLDAPCDVREPFLRQHERLAKVLSGFTEEQWRSPSRCAGWSALDVAIHLNSTNRFWHASIAGGLAGEPTRYLGAFDPTATPAAMVEAARAAPLEETLEQVRTSDRAFCDLVAGLDAAGWATLAEAPPGHVPVQVLVHHALWDAWVHERDILLPLGLVPAEEPDEVLACLRYGAALGPALALGLRLDAPPGALVVEVRDPDARFVVEVSDVVRVHQGPAPEGAIVIRGDALEVVEILSVRVAGGDVIPESAGWWAGALAGVFETEPAG